MGAGCIVDCNKVSKPVKGKYYFSSYLQAYQSSTITVELLSTEGVFKGHSLQLSM